MSKKDDELKDFVDEVTDGAYNLPCVKVIFKLVKQIQAWGDENQKHSSCTSWKTTGKQHDDLKKNTMDKTLESTLKEGMNTKFPTCHDKGVFTDDDGTYRERK
jgi:hypothetical protein